MIRPAKIITVCAGAILAAVLIALIGINLYLQSEEVQLRIRRAAENAVGAPVLIKSTTYTPWSGLTLSGLTVPGWLPNTPNLFEASKFSVRFELLPVLKKRFVIRDVMLDRPVFALRQHDDGKWSLQPPAEMLVDAIPTLDIVPPDIAVADPDPTPGVEMLEPIPMISSEVAPIPFVVELKKLQMTEGRVILIDRKGRPYLNLRNVTITVDMESMSAGSGQFSATALDFAEALKPRNLRGNFAFDGGDVRVTEIFADLADGLLTADFSLNANSGTPSFLLSAKATRVSVPKLLTDATGEGIGAAGTLDAAIQLTGTPSDSKSMTGRGHVTLNEARMQPAEFLRQIGTLLRIDELQMLDLGEAVVEFTIADQRIHVERMLLASENLRITATGPIRFNGKMALDARLMINEKLQRQLRAVLSDNFTASEDANYRQVTFSIDGRVSRPETDLIERMTGLQLGSFSGLLRGFLQSQRKQTPPPAPAD